MIFMYAGFRKLDGNRSSQKLIPKDCLPHFIAIEIQAHQRYLKTTQRIFNPPPYTLPSWLTEEDLDCFASKYSATGFTGGFNYYRCFDLNWELCGPWMGSKITVPVKFIVGDLDLTYHFPGAKEYIHGDAFKKLVPGLEEVVVMEGGAHFINQEKPQEINNHIYDFITKF